ncbi:MAG: hypothetical protein EOO38_23655 [Cytophagaceae bacterium]|nr:MAG: hypothetical protein EOO38_23655 [Cytophagaceae bacterium]
MMSFSEVKDVASGSLLSACGINISYDRAINASKKNTFLRRFFGRFATQDLYKFHIRYSKFHGYCFVEIKCWRFLYALLITVSDIKTSAVGVWKK